MAYAQVDKVTALYSLVNPDGLTAAKENAVDIMLDWVEAEILDRYPDILDATAYKLSQLEQVEVAAVLRVLRNPSGLRQFSGSIDDGSESGTIDTILSTGQLYVTDAEWDKLERSVGSSGGSWSIVPSYE